MNLDFNLEQDLEKIAKVDFTKIKSGIRNIGGKIKDVAAGKGIKEYNDSIKKVGKSHAMYPHARNKRNLEVAKTVGLYASPLVGAAGAGAVAGRALHKNKIDKAAYEILEYGLNKEAKMKFGNSKKINLKGVFSGENVRNAKNELKTIAHALGKDSNAFKDAQKVLKREKLKRGAAYTAPVVGAGVGAGALAGAGYAAHKNKHKDDIDKAAYEILEYGLNKEAKVNFKKIKEGVGKAKTSIKEIANGKRIKDNYNTLKFLKKSDPEYQRYNKIMKKELGKTIGLHTAGGVSVAGLTGAGAYAGYKKHKEK